MSLLSDRFEDCTMIDKTTVEDGYGGYLVQWVDGAKFRAAVVFDNSLEARTAMQDGVTNVYTVTTGKAINLQYHDVFRRESDGKIFRVKSDGDDNKAPDSAGPVVRDMRQVSAEEWVLPSE